MKHIRSAFLFFTFIVPALVSGDGGNHSWAKVLFAGKESGEPLIARTRDGGLVMMGKSKNDRDVDDLFLMKIAPDGNIEWQRFLAHSYPKNIVSLIQTADGGYVCAGGQELDQEFSEALLIRFDSGGRVLWQHRFSGPLDEHFSKIAEDDSGNLIAVGGTSSFSFKYNESNGLIVKLDRTGKVLWQRHYGGEGGEGFFSLVVEKDGYVVAGDTSSWGAGADDFWVLKIAENGNIIWQKTYGGKRADVAYQIQKTTDGNYLVAGTTTGFKSRGTDTLILKIGPSGSLIWQRLIADPRDVTFSTFFEKSDGSILVIGDAYFKSPSMGNDIHATFVKLSSTGDLLFQKRLNSKQNEQIWPNAHAFLDFGSDESVFTGLSLSFNDAIRDDIFVARIRESSLSRERDAAYTISAPGIQTSDSKARFAPSGLKVFDTTFQQVERNLQSRDIGDELLAK